MMKAMEILVEIHKGNTSKEPWPQGTRYLDLETAKEFIESWKEDLLAVEAGIMEDLSLSGATIWREGEYQDYGLYAAQDQSEWATPIIKAHWKDGRTCCYACWKTDL